MEAERTEPAEPSDARWLLLRCLSESGGPPSAWRLLADLELDAGEDPRPTLLRAVAVHPGDAYAWAALGRAEADAGAIDRAASALDRAARLRPDDAALAREAERARARNGDHSAEMDRRVTALIEEAEGRRVAGDADGARKTIAEARAAASATLEARVHLAAAWLDLSEGDGASALAAAKAGLGANPSPAVAADLWCVLAEALLMADSLHEAAEAADRARKLVPGHPWASTNLALALARAGALDEAAAALTEALDAGLADRIERRKLEALDGVGSVLTAHPELASRIDAAYAP